MAQTVTKEQVGAAIKTVAAVAEAVRELGEVPSGHLYARLAPVMGLETFHRIIATLKKSGLVEEQNHLLRWIGPTK